jgi:predicted ArsR family transcriptional regulator
MVGMQRPPPFVISDQALLDPRTLRVLSDPLRSFIVYSLVEQAKTVKQLAHELSCPPTRLYYHMQQLEKHRLVGVERTRLISGITEKHYRATAREFLLDRETFRGRAGADQTRVDALLAFVFDQTRQEIQRQIGAGTIDPTLRGPQVGALIAYRNVLRLDQAQAQRLYERLFDFWQEYEAAAKSPAPDGEFYAFTVALYPNAPTSEPDPPLPARSKSRQGKR